MTTDISPTLDLGLMLKDIGGSHREGETSVEVAKPQNRVVALRNVRRAISDEERWQPWHSGPWR